MVTTVNTSIGSKSKSILSSTNASPIVVELASGHGFIVGEYVFVSSHSTNTNANGNWRISAVDATHVTLQGSSGNGVGGATGFVGRTYADIPAWITATTGNLVSANEVRIGNVYQDAATDNVIAPSTPTPDISGATVDSTRYRMLRSGVGHRFSAFDLTGVFVRKTMGGVGSSGWLKIGEAFCRIEGIGGIVLDNSLTSGGPYYGVEVAASDVLLDSVWSKYTGGSGTIVSHCIAHTSGSRLVCRNCIAAGDNSEEWGASRGFSNVAGSANDEFYNCAAYGCKFNTGAGLGYGFRLDSTSGTTIVQNCVAIDNPNTNGGNDFAVFSSATFSYCIAGDSSAPLGFSYDNVAANVAFKYAQADDFRNRFTSPGLQTGTVIASFSNAFDGSTRGIYWDIGPYSGAVDSSPVPPTDVIYSIGSGGGRDYTSIATWMAATALHLISRNERHIGVLYDDSDHTIITNKGLITGAVTDERCYRILRAADGQRYDPITDTGVWITGSVEYIISGREDYFRLEGVGVENTSNSAAGRKAVEFTGRGCIADGVYAEVLASTGSADACFYGRSRENQSWRNCIAVGAGAGSAGANYGFRATGDTPSLYNCVAYKIDGAGGSSWGVHTTDALARVTNTVAMDCDVDFGSTAAPIMDYCISSDATAAGPHSLPSLVATDVFSGPNQNDFRLLPDSDALNAGFPLSTIFASDFAGDTRSKPWEIGAYDGFAFTLPGAAPVIGRTSALATLWLIEREDGTALAFTDHNREITHGGTVYSPGGGFDQSNRRQSSALKDSNVEFRGAVSSDTITDDDLWAKRYDGAKVTERIVNWRFPWSAPILTSVFFVAQVEWTGEEWIAQLENQAARFNEDVGVVTSRDCRHQLGDAKCGFDVRLQSQYAQSVTSVPTDRAIFRASGLSSETDEHFRFGLIEWLTGDNAGTRSEVLRYTDTNREFELQEPTFFSIQAGDTFNAIVGCSGLFDDCRDKFANLPNFGGWPFMPSIDRMLEGPVQ